MEHDGGSLATSGSAAAVAAINLQGDTKNLAILTKWPQNTRLGSGPIFGVALYTVTNRSITRVGESSAGFGGLDGEKHRASRIG
ncbi:MAG: hypothetical protein VX170_15150, partial [Pseudomonadota bacterium]|nr:hypothetical protein [Pseudomonadota bacterium]